MSGCTVSDKVKVKIREGRKFSSSLRFFLHLFSKGFGLCELLQK